MKPVKPKPATPPATGAKTFDPLLDALPQPDMVVESDSDTAWGLWQESIMPSQDTQPAPFKESAFKESAFKDSVYKDTEPMGLPDLPPPKKPSGSSS
jgi:hypothetical protein